MTQEEKDLLLKDLSSRLFNKVMIYLHTSSEMTGSSIVLNSSIYGFIEDVLNNSPYEIKEIKPYLRSMSSMNEEEKKEFTHIASLQRNYLGDDNFYTHYQMIDWLIKNHFDYRGLIQKDLAIEAPEGMYKTKE